jgi:DNA-binding response OmpR family regulator
MQTITPQQRGTLHAIASEARQTIDGDSPLYAVMLYESDTDVWTLEVHVWHTRKQKDEQDMHTAVFDIRDKIREAGIPCDLELADRGIYQATYELRP